MELNQSQRANTSPKDAADEIRAQLEEYRGLNIPDFLRWAPKPGREAEELDPLRVATRAAERIGICGTFPRGKMVLIYRGGGAAGTRGTPMQSPGLPTLRQAPGAPFG